MAEDVIGRPKLQLGIDRKQLKADGDVAAADAKKIGEKVGKAFSGGAKMSKADKALDSYQKRLKSLVQDLRGDKATWALRELEGAVQQVGGAAKLSATNIERLRSRIQGLQAQGGRVPVSLQTIMGSGKSTQGMLAVSGAMEKIQHSASGALGKLGPLGGALGALGPIGLAVGASLAAATFGITKLIGTLVEWSQQAIASASEITNTATEIGWGTDALQEWVYAADQAGVKTEVLAKGAADVTRRIGEGGKSVTDALDMLGLSIEELRGYQPEQQFEVILRSLKRLSDPSLQAALATDLFGENPKLLRLLRSDFDAARFAAESMGAVLGRDVLDATRGFGDRLNSVSQAWDNFKIALVSGITTSPEAARGLEEIAKSLGSITAKLIELTPRVVEFTNKIVNLARLYAVVGASIGGGAGPGAAAGYSFAKHLTEPAGGTAPSGEGEGEDEYTRRAQEIRERFEAAQREAEAKRKAAEASREAADAKRDEAEASRILADIERQLVEEEERFAPALEQEIAKRQRAAAAIVAQAKADLAAKKIDEDTYNQRISAADALLTRQVKNLVHAEDEKRSIEERTIAIDQYVAAQKEQEQVLGLLGPTADQARAEFDRFNASLEANGGLTNLTRKQLETYIQKLRELEAQGVPVYRRLADAMAEAEKRGLKLEKPAIDLRKLLADLGSIVDKLAGQFREMGMEGAAQLAEIASAATNAAAAIASGNIAGAISAGFDLGQSVGRALGLGGPSNEEIILAQAGQMGLSASEEFWKQFGRGDNLFAGYYLNILDALASEGLPAASLSAEELGHVFSESWKRGAEGLENVRDVMAALEDEVERGVPGALDTLDAAMDQVFQQMRTGQMSAVTGAELLGEAFTSLGQAAENGISGARDEMLELIREAKEAGVVVPEIAAAIRQNMAQVAEGLTKLPPIMSPKDARSQAILFADTWRETVQNEGFFAAMDQLGPAFERIQQQAEAVGFDVSAILGGSTAELLQAANPQALIDALAEKLKAGEITQAEHDAQVAALEEQRQRLEGVDALRQVVQGLADSDALSSRSFEAAQQQAVSAYDQLVAGGMSEEAAREAIAPMLAELVQAGQRFGEELSPELQALLGDDLKIASDANREMADSLTGDVVPLLQRIAANTGAGVEFPELATGGIAMSPMVAALGERPEAVLPLDRLGPMLEAALFSALGRAGGLGSSPGGGTLRLVDGAGRILAEGVVDEITRGGPSSRRLAAWQDNGVRR